MKILTQVLSNLAINASKFTSHGFVELACTAREEHGIAAVSESPLYAAIPDLVIVPGTGPHDVSPTELPVVCLDRKCGEAVMTGADVFAPGVKGLDGGISTGDTVACYIDIDNTTLRGQPGPFFCADSTSSSKRRRRRKTRNRRRRYSSNRRATRPDSLPHHRRHPQHLRQFSTSRP